MTKKARPIRIEGNIAYVPLTRGYEAVIDVADVALVEGVNWYAFPKNDTVYAIRHTRKGGKFKIHRMHRIIAHAPVGMEVDHIDRNTLNNRRENLRVCTNSENQRNRTIQKNNTSGAKGVNQCKSSGKWVARIMIFGKSIYLGQFDELEDADTAYREASERYHGAFGRTE